MTVGSAPENVEEAIDALYGLDPAQLVPARNELVRRLRKAGNKDAADRVAQLRRPSPAAWAVNQLARRHRSELDDLVRLGELLRAAQTRTLAGADAAALRDAGRARREAVARLTETAMRLLTERGTGASAHQAEVAATLEAASLDAQAAEEASSGRLTSALEPPSGFEALGMDADAPTTSDDDAQDPIDAEPADTTVVERLTAAQQAVAEANRVAAERSEDARDALALAGRRHRELDQAEAKLARLERVLDEARHRAHLADRDCDRAQKAAAAAEAKAAEAAQRVEDLRADRH